MINHRPITMNLKIKYLADEPSVVPVLAKWTCDRWSQYDPNLTIERVTQSLKERMNTAEIPFTVVAFDSNTPIGMATLKESIPVAGYDDNGPWLGSLFVADGFRGQGVGTKLLKQIFQDAKNLGYQKIYMFTSEIENVAWYEHGGWIKFADDKFHGKPVTLMYHELRI